MSSNCSDCYNGCTETTSDKCVRYTGVDYPILGIKTGDSLSYIEQVLAGFLIDTLDGTGIIPTIPPNTLCTLISSKLPTCSDVNIVDIAVALIKASCELETLIQGNTTKINTIEADYTIECLTGVTAASGTHAIVQAVITKLCQVDSAVTALATTLTTQYVKIADINSYIAAYLTSLPVSSLISSKMVPYVAVPYYGSLTNFDITGAGTGDWVKIYLCNGANATPDLRGRALVGTTTMGNTVMNPAVDPAVPGNPTYNQGTTTGSNLSILSTPAQLPAHTHSGTTSSSGAHTHTVNQILGYGPTQGKDGFYDRSQGEGPYGIVTDSAGSHTHTFTTSSIGASEGHPNIQPVYATNFIIYIP